MNNLYRKSFLSIASLLLMSSHFALASPSSIANDLFNKYGVIQTSGGEFNRQKQASLVKQWIARYANNNHPLKPMERMIISGYAMNASELKDFGCKKSLLGGYKCSDLKQGSGYLKLNTQKQATSGDLCMPIPSELIQTFRRFGGMDMVSFAKDLSVLAYNEQSKIMDYRVNGSNLCAEFDL